jgi:imidazole glycerol phosphate synthase glutamine amidotransferase subunit
MARRRVAIVDHKMSNLRSITNACHYALDAEVTLVQKPEEIRDCGHLILPGVGAFGAAMQVLRDLEITEALREHVEAGRPLFGVCLGFQLLFNTSSEHGQHEGLGILDGDVVRFETDLHIPHVGWNVFHTDGEHPVFSGLGADREHAPYMYFVHSYYPQNVPADIVTGTSNYGEEFVCAVGSGTVAGTQFHPEKSGADGLRIVRNFLDWRP